MKEAANNPFDISNLDHERVRRFKPAFMAQGGINLVYALPNYPDLIVKAGWNEILFNILDNVRNDRPIDSNPYGSEENRQLKWYQQTLNQARTIFGEEHIPPESVHHLKVPVSRQLVEELREKPLDSPIPTELWRDTVWTQVAIQSRVEGLDEPGVVTVYGGYAEEAIELNNLEHQLDYKIATDAYLLSPEPGKHVLRELFLLHPDLEKTGFSAFTDRGFTKALKDFVRKAMRFSKKTGEPMDLMGAGNVFFIPQTEGNWDYKIVDFMTNRRFTDEKFTDDVTRAVRARNWNPVREIKHMLNYVRIVNGLAEIAGIRERINLFPEGTDIDPIELLFRIRGERMITAKRPDSTSSLL